MDPIMSEIIDVIDPEALPEEVELHGDPPPVAAVTPAPAPQPAPSKPAETEPAPAARAAEPTPSKPAEPEPSSPDPTTPRPAPAPPAPPAAGDVLGSEWAFVSPRARSIGRRGPAVALAIAAALAIGLAAFAFLRGAGSSEPAPSGAAGEPAAPSSSSPAVAAPEQAAPVTVTEIVVTDAVDPVTGTPDTALDSFTTADPIHLWFAFEAAPEASGSTVSIHWFRGERRVARSDAALPTSGAAMNLTLPDGATDRSGIYRVEVRADGEVLAQETFEVRDE